VGLSLLPFYPLAYGLLTGKYRRGEPAPPGTRLELQSARLETADFDRIDELAAFAAARDLSLLDVAIGWLAAQPYVGSVMAGVTSAEQVRANVEAARWHPSDDDLTALEELTA
jgi:aryl-alcohol dehydrogenase-like predicted oxidoreductase